MNHSTSKGYTKLCRLNDLLKQHADALGLPTFKREVSSSFGNHDWLKKKIAVRADCPQEIAKLLALDPKSLLQEYQVPGMDLGQLVAAKVAEASQVKDSEVLVMGASS